MCEFTVFKTRVVRKMLNAKFLLLAIALQCHVHVHVVTGSDNLQLSKVWIFLTKVIVIMWKFLRTVGSCLFTSTGWAV